MAMGSSPVTVVLSLLLIISTTHASHSHRPKLATSEEFEESLASSPTTIFEVTRPIPVPNNNPCSTVVLQHDFAYTYGHPPVTAPYRPPPHCPQLGRQPPSRIVLEWSASSTGTQYDRIFGVWMSGVELLRSCTAEPTSTGVVWTVKKDVTRYLSLLSRPQTLAVFLGNLVNDMYTGVYHATVSLHFYFPGSAGRQQQPHPVPAFTSPADLILPISRPFLPPGDGLWFSIQSSTDVQSKNLTVPTNAYRAVVELYLSFHNQDEFWYADQPNTGNGTFREVTVSLDGVVVGAVWPFTVIYTGGFNPLFWRPITGIGSFDLPSYDIEITPFLGRILDGKPHSFGLGVTGAQSFWCVDANLHLWLDSKSSHTTGELISYNAPGFVPSLVSRFKGSDGYFQTSAKREISSTGWVNSSYGQITTHFFQTFDYNNLMEFEGNGSIQVVNQTTDFNYGTYYQYTKNSSSSSSALYSEQVFQSFPLYIYEGNTDASVVTNVSLGFNTKKLLGEKLGLFSSVRNSQNADADYRVKNNVIKSGVVGTRQFYRYESSDGCYFRNVSSSNLSILNDESGESCTKDSSLANNGN